MRMQEETKKTKKKKKNNLKTISAFWLFSKRCPFVFRFLLFIIDFMCLISFIKPTHINFTIELKRSQIIKKTKKIKDTT